jgi:hypothetical protein
MITSKADIYSRDDLLYVVTLALTRRGYTFETDQVHTLSDAVDSETLGTTVLRALGAYEATVPDIGDPRQHAAAMLRTLGFKSLRQFERGAKLIGVQIVDGIALVLPTKPYGRGGYLGLTKSDAPDGGILHVNLEPAALGEAIRSCLAIRTTHPVWILYPCSLVAYKKNPVSLIARPDSSLPA